MDGSEGREEEKWREMSELCEDLLAEEASTVAARYREMPRGSVSRSAQKTTQDTLRAADSIEGLARWAVTVHSVDRNGGSF